MTVPLPTKRYPVRILLEIPSAGFRQYVPFGEYVAMLNGYRLSDAKQEIDVERTEGATAAYFKAQTRFIGEDGSTLATATYATGPLERNESTKSLTDRVETVKRWLAGHRGRVVTYSIDPQDFVTEFDSLPNNVARYAGEQYRNGYDMGSKGATVYIAINGVWSADLDDGYTSSYERLGYHACTADLVRGWKDGGAIIIDYRNDPTREGYANDVDA